MTAIVEELEGHHALTDANFHAAIDLCLTPNNGKYQRRRVYICRHGGLLDWDVSRVTNFTQAFANRASSTRTCRDGTRRARRVSTRCLKTRQRLTGTCQSGKRVRGDKGRNVSRLAVFKSKNMWAGVRTRREDLSSSRAQACGMDRSQSATGRATTTAEIARRNCPSTLATAAGLHASAVTAAPPPLPSPLRCNEMS